MEGRNTVMPTWYLLQCKAHQDNRAEEHLRRQDYEIFRPHFVTQRVVRGKPMNVLESLFPGYLFIRLAADSNWSSLRSTRGVLRLVGFNQGPTNVPDTVIELLRARCDHMAPVQLFRPGEPVQIVQGPLNTLEGIFLSMDGQDRVRILLHLLNQDRPVRVPLSYVKSA